jgi:biofilm PGA synthesis N-glycosyltransferase PgaC
VNPRILIVSPVRNEARHIERVALALAAQDLPPQRWIVLDDRSTDATRTLLWGLRSQIDFLEVHDLPARAPHAGARDRLARAAAARNFNVGMSLVDRGAYTHVMKLDGDIELPPGYLRTLMERFAADRRIGLAGGVLVEPLPGGGAMPIRIPRRHVHGALKCWSRECFEAIGGVQERLGWDTIDEVYARMRGFVTVSFEDLVAVHHRPWGSADGVLRGRRRLGECAWVTHYPPWWVLLRSLKLACGPPRFTGGAAYLGGYLAAAACGRERVADAEFRRFVRRELRERLLAGATARGSQTVAASGAAPGRARV